MAVIRTVQEETREHIDVFCCYARKDQAFLQELKNHLMPLKREGLIQLWADTDINAGTEWEKEIHLHLNTSHLILLLVSPDFMASDYCYSTEMTQAMKRHQNGEAQVIPIILRPVDWQSAPFARLQVLPQDAHPIISREWSYPDEGFADTAKGIRKAVEALLSIRPVQQTYAVREPKQARPVEKQLRKTEEATQARRNPASQRSTKKDNSIGTVTRVSEDRDTVLASQVLEALGGRSNVESIEGCATRLRLFVKEPGQIDDTRLKSLGAVGVITHGRVAQVVMGPLSNRIAERMKNLMKEANEEIIIEEEQVTSQGRDKGENKRKRNEFITSSLKIRPFALHLQLFALLTGLGLLVDLFIHQDLNRPWAVGVVALSVPLVYLLGYRKAIHFLSISLIGIMSVAVVFGMAFSFSGANFDHPTTSQLWFNLTRILWLGRQVNFGLIVGGIVGIMVGRSLVFDGYYGDDWTVYGVWFGLAVLFIPFLWLIVAIFASLFQWGFGFGYGWDTSLVVAVIGYLTVVGFIYLCYVCILAYNIPIRKLLSFF